MEPRPIFLRQLLAITDDDDDEWGAVGEILGRGNRNIRRKSAPVPLCSPRIPHYLTRRLVV
jgi:hypothetical protein